MTHSEEEREFWFLQPRASNEMHITEDGFKAFSRIFILAPPPENPENLEEDFGRGRGN